MRYFHVRNSILFFVSILFSLTCFARTVVSGERLWNLQKLVTEASCDATVHQSDFSAGVLTIASSGVRCLAESLTGKIIISADNVVLDLNGKKISNTTDDTIVVSGASNCTVTNGSLSSTTGRGIYVSSGSRLSIKDILVSDCIEGIRFENTIDAIVKGCELVSSITGITIEDSVGVSIEDTIASMNDYAGFSLISSEANTLLHCKAVNTGQELTSVEQNVYGFISENGTSNIFDSCIAQSTLALTVTSETSKVAGFDLKGTETHSEIINCTVDVVETDPDGLAIPYGILLESNFSELTTVTGAAQGVNGVAVAWSPDGAYLATGGQPENGVEIQIFLFDRVAGTLTLTDTQSQGSIAYSLDWHPSGDYLATIGDDGTDAIQIFSFNRVSGKLTKTDGQAQGASGNDIAWTPNGVYLATAGANNGAADDEIQIFLFDRDAGTLTRTDGVSHGAVAARGCAWTFDGSYLATASSESTSDIKIFSFDRNTGTLSLTDSKDFGDGAVRLAWSPDNYLAVAGYDAGAEIHVYSFNSSSGTLTLADTVSQGTTDAYSVSWSPDGAYLATSGDPEGTNDIQIFLFNRVTEQLTFVTGAVQGGFGGITEWSPDGAYFASAGARQGDNSIQIFQAFIFPSSNVIKNNVVHGISGSSPFGAGISGSSIENFIFGNSAYNNTSFNYQFVTNIYDQRFDSTTSLLQNLSMKTKDPIFAP